MAPRLRYLALLALIAGVYLSCNRSKVNPVGPSPEAPAAPANLIVVGTGEDWLRLNWHALADNEDGFNVYWLLNNTWQRFDTTFPPSPIENVYDTVRGLQPGTNYRFRLTAFNAAGESNPSNEASGRTSGTLPPLPPINVRADTLGYNIVKVTWTPTDTVNGFRIGRREPSTQWTELRTVGGADTTYIDSLAEALTTYYYRVGSVRGTRVTWCADSAVATTPDAPPLPPDSVLVQSFPGVGLRVTWIDRSANELGFRLGRSTNGQAWVVIDSVGADVLVYFDSLRNAVGSYAYRVQAYNAVGSSYWVTGTSFYYGLCSDGVIPLCLGNWWQYTVYDSIGPDYNFRRDTGDLRIIGGLDYYLITVSQDTLYYLRNFDTGCWKLPYPLGADTNRVQLYRYPGNVGDRYVVDGDTMLVASTSTDVVVSGTLYLNCYVYQRALGPGHTVTIYVKPQTLGVVRELEVVNDVTLARRDIVDWAICSS